MSGVFTDENNNHKIDLSAATWSYNEMHEDYELVGSVLKDADWLAQDDDGILLIEYKNYKERTGKEFREYATGTKSEALADEIAKKFYDSLHLLVFKGISCTKTKIRYVFIVEHRIADPVMKKRMRNKISEKLPFRLQAKFGLTVIDKADFKVLSVDEWNNSPQYSVYPITSIIYE